VMCDVSGAGGNEPISIYDYDSLNIKGSRRESAKGREDGGGELYDFLFLPSPQQNHFRDSLN
jgi:hypothetical protein